MKYDAIILAGGAGSRLGGVEKAQLDLAGAPLIDRPLAACRGAGRIVVVGPQGALASRSATSQPIAVTREEPPGGGPAAATSAGVHELLAGEHAPWVLLLSCDLPLAVEGVRRLLEHVEADLAARPRAGDAEARGEVAPGQNCAPDGYCLTDDDGRRQWLFALYRVDSLRRAVHRCPDPSGTSMRRLLDGVHLRLVPHTEEVSGDLDTWDDHAAWTATLENRQD